MKDNVQELQKLRHSAAHLLAHAVIELFPDTQLTIGPATETGFFYDFLPSTNFKEEDLVAISARMQEIAERNLPLTHEAMPKQEARELYKNNPFKLELIDGIAGDHVGIARQGDFYDLCKGGHVASTGALKNTALLNLSGSYWRAERTNQALQRISGTAFATAKELRVYLQRREDALKYDHRKVGLQQELFSFHEEGPGFAFFHPKGTTVLNTLKNFLQKKLERLDYKEIKTPCMLSDELWKRSGHYQHYKDNMYFCTIDEKSYAIKPMNCPGSILIYQERPHSYRELPLKLAEFGLVHRYELSGVLHGLLRVRSFTQDDGHIYCTPDQIEDVIFETIKLTYDILNAFDFEKITVAVSTKPTNAMGSDQLWEKATIALESALKRASIVYKVQEGEGAFYGPKIEFGILDSMERSWQCSTIQVDFFQPENFDLSYVTSEGTKSRPVMIHRAIYGSFERFFAILLEHYKGKLPFWLAPIQIKMLTITDEYKPYAHTIEQTLKDNGLRVAFDHSSDQISGKIKRAQIEQIPWMVVIGQKEVENNTVTLRHRDGKQEFGLTVDAVVEKARQENK
jgi:threonyl-tRNA synthetase